MKSNFEFLDKEFPVLSQFGKKAETYLYSDSNSCLMKLGMIGETIVNLMFTYDRIMPPSENTAVNRIGVLFREGLLTQDLVDILHALRKVRNKAVHENYRVQKGAWELCFRRCYFSVEEGFPLEMLFVRIKGSDRY